MTIGAAVDAAEVKLARGAHKVTTDHEGATVSTAYEASARLWLEIGDRALLAPVDLEDDRIAVVEVAHVYADGSTLEVFRVCGELAPGSVFIMRGPKPRETRPAIRRATVREVERPGQALADLIHAKRLAISGGGQ